MKAIVYSETGSTEVLRLVERPVPDPAPGQIRLRIAVSGVNPTDWKSRQGTRPGEALAFADIVPNQDGAGVVDAIGADVIGFALGDRVWTVIAAYRSDRGGTAQEFALVEADRVYPLPATASFDLGASLGVPAVTAHRALTMGEGLAKRLHPGALAGVTVLVAGGAGAVGHAAIQLARWAGATVISTVSGPAKGALAAAAGAHHVVDYRAGDAAAEIRALAPDGVDLVVEVAPAVNAALNLAIIKNHGTIAVYANNGGDVLTLDVRNHFSLNVRYQFVLLYTVGGSARDAAASDLIAAMNDGAIPVGAAAGLPLHRFSLEHTALAHAAVENNVVGKVLITVADL